MAKLLVEPKEHEEAIAQQRKEEKSKQKFIERAVDKHSSLKGKERLLQLLADQQVNLVLQQQSLYDDKLIKMNQFA